MTKIIVYSDISDELTQEQITAFKQLYNKLMKKFTIFYRDSIGRKNQAERFGYDSDDARRKFNILYVGCTILDIV